MPTHKHSFSELVDSANLRKLTAKTVKTYPQDWIVIHEVLQNAKDAIQRGTKDQGTISIAFDLETEKVSIRDDGPGFPHNPHLFGLGGTDKDEDDVDDLRINGNQGVGLKVVIFSTIKFRMHSVADGQTWQAWVDNAVSYFGGADVQINMTDPVETPEEPGTFVEYQFGQPHVSDFIESLYSRYHDRVHDDVASRPLAKLKTVIEYYFRTYSYAGDVNRLAGDPSTKPINIEIAISCPSESKPDAVSDELWKILRGESPLRITFPNKHWDITEAVEHVPKGRPKPHILTDVSLSDGGDIGRRSENYVWVAALQTPEDFARLIMNQRLRRPVDPKRHQTLFERTESIYVAIGSRTVLEKFLLEPPRQFVAACGVPSAHSLQTPTRGEEASYVTNNIHFILNLRERLNYGKQTISNPRLLGLANHFFGDAVRATLRNVARCIVGSILGSSTGDDVDDLIQQETNILDRPDIGLKDFSIVKTPFDENALIAIFYELMGRGHLEGIRSYSLHQKTTYDGRVVLRTENQPEFPPVRSDNDLKNIEFKRQLSVLVYDFEEGLKVPELISLAVVWENDLKEDHPNFQVVGIEHTRDADRRIPGVEQILLSRQTGRSIQLLILKDVIDRIRG